MKKILPALAIVAITASPAFSQTAADVLRYSYLQPGGTARSLGAGNAFGALGAEFGALSMNPAGIALFRTDELVVTPSLRFAETDAGLPGSPALTDNKSTFAFDNFGLLFNDTPGEKWTTFNFAVGVNRQNNYASSIYYEGDAAGTIMNGLYNDAVLTVNNGGSPDDFYPFDTKLAYDASAIYQDASTGEWIYDFLGNEDAALNRSQAVNTFGRMNEMIMSFGGNYREKLMVGATIGIPFVNYRIEGEYIETDRDDAVPFFDRLTYTEYLRTEGVGVNLKLGLIYKLNQTLRIGAAFHTPTALRLTDTYTNTFAYEYTVNGDPYGGTPYSPETDGVTDYRLRTPWRASASAAAVIGKTGFLSADVEIVDYSNNAYNFTADIPSQANQAAEREVNRDIQKAYGQALNLRIGGEVAIEDFRLRGGLNMYGKPQEGETGFNTAISAGAGVRLQSFYLDLGWRRYVGKGSLAPYSGAPVATTTNAVSDVLLTLGFKF